MMDLSGERIRTFAVAAGMSRRVPAAATGPIAVGWATVDLDRAVGQLARAFGVDAAAFVEAAPSIALGARCRVVHAVDALGSAIALAVLEPATEGRLAAALARNDEGPVAAWYATVDAAGGAVDALPGPFGSEWLLGAGRTPGPYRLLVAAGTGTIAS
jgi:hypothetical protein